MFQLRKHTLIIVALLVLVFSPVFSENWPCWRGPNGDGTSADGRILWKVPHENSALSFSTPIFRKLAGRMQMIFCGNQQVISYNPDDGASYLLVPKNGYF